MEIESNLWYPPRSLNENIIKVGFRARKINNILLGEYFFIFKKKSKILRVVNKIKKIKNIFFVVIPVKYSIVINIVPNNPLLVKPSK